MMDIVVRYGRKKMKIPLSSTISGRIEEISQKYDKSPIDILNMMLNSKFEDHSLPSVAGEIEEHKKELEKILKYTFMLESKYAALKYETHTYVKENKALAITLSGLVSENKSLRRRMKLPLQDLKKVEKLIDEYLFGL